VSGQSFEFSYAPQLRALFTVLGIGPRWSRVEVDAENVRVRMGWAFATTIPRSSIALIETDDRLVTGWGVHGWGGRWLVNGSSDGLVRLDIRPPARAFVIGAPLKLHTLRLSMTDPHGLIWAIDHRQAR
jgi:hypothetical protein